MEIKELNYKRKEFIPNGRWGRNTYIIDCEFCKKEIRRWSLSDLKNRTALCVSCCSKKIHTREAIDLNEKECIECKILLPIKEFGFNGKEKKHKKDKCIKCNNLSKFSLNRKTYNEIAKLQDNKCCICLKEKRLAVDHCHKNGHVRGLLCEQCNQGLGLYYDNIQSLENAIKYLKDRGKDDKSPPEKD